MTFPEHAAHVGKIDGGHCCCCLEWVTEVRLACVDGASRDARHCPWSPGPSERPWGCYCHLISVSKRHGLP